jgi:hypothetical protein
MFLFLLAAICPYSVERRYACQLPCNIILYSYMYNDMCVMI